MDQLSTPKVAAALIGSILSAALAWPVAAAAQPIRVANWSGGPIFKAGTRQFERCSASATNSSGIAITYAMDDRMRWYLAISSANWSFTDGFSLGIDLKVDERRFRGRGIVRDNSLLDIDVEDRIALFATLRMAGQLRAVAGGFLADFDVSRSSEVFAAVAKCAVLHSRTPEANALRGSWAEGARGTGSQDVAMIKELTEFATALRDYANIPGFRLAGPSAGLPGASAAVGWTAERGSGVLLAVPARGSPNASDLVTRIVQFEQRRCRGEYFFIASADTHQAPVHGRVYAACKLPETTNIVFYLVVPRSARGAYVLSNASGQGFALTLQRETELIDSKFRNALPRALRKLEEPPTPTVESPTNGPVTAPSRPADQ